MYTHSNYSQNNLYLRKAKLDWKGDQLEIRSVYEHANEKTLPVVHVNATRFVKSECVCFICEMSIILFLKLITIKNK